MNKENQKKLQEKYIEFQIMDQQMKQIEKQIDAVSSQIQELAITSQSIDELSNVKTGTEIFVPLSKGIFTKAELKGSKEMLINVGSNTVVKKSVSDAKKFVEKQMEEITKVLQQLMAELQKMATKANAVEKEIIGLSR